MQFLSQKAASLTPYVAGIQPATSGWVKLNTNENPYPPSPRVADTLGSFDLSRLRLYPDGDSTLLLQALSQRFGLPVDHIFVGNGSDEVLAFAFSAFFSGKTHVLTPDISYGFYPVWAQMFDVSLTTVPLSDVFAVDPTAYRGANGVVIANPNAPTGIALSCDEIEQIVLQNPHGVVIIDEAYIDFSETASAVSLVEKYHNLLVVQTFSKSHALAGLRVGFAFGHPDLIAGLNRVKNAVNSYPLDMLAEQCAAASLSDVGYFRDTVEKIVHTREHTAGALATLGYRALPSGANFLFVRCDRAGALYEHLRNHNILVRYWDKPRIDAFLRITIGTLEEMEALLSCVSQF